MTGKEQQVEPDFSMEAVPTDDDQVVPDLLEERSMVATSAEALEELGLDAVDLVDEAPSFFESTSERGE